MIEEGPLADWLQRGLCDLVDDFVVCDPHRNALITKDGEKNDHIDGRKLAHLSQGGYLRRVYHSGVLSRSIFKQRVLLYHERVRHRVSEGHKLIWRVRGMGIILKHKGLDEQSRQEMLDRLPPDERAREDVLMLLAGYDQACAGCEVKNRSDP